MTLFVDFLLVTVVNLKMFIFAICLYGEVQVGITFTFPTTILYFNIYFLPSPTLTPPPPPSSPLTSAKITKKRRGGRIIVKSLEVGYARKINM